MVEALSKGTVLVTGVSGFLGSQVAYECLSNGYKVIGSIRSKKSPDKLENLKKLPNQENLKIVLLDLLNQEAVKEETKEVTGIIHTGVPSPELIPGLKKAIAEAKLTIDNLLQACKTNNIKSLVYLSTLSTMFSLNTYKYPVNCEDWADDGAELPRWTQLKTVSERYLWSQQATVCGDLKLTTIHSELLVGNGGYSNLKYTKRSILMKLLSDKIPGVPNLQIAVVDVEDCARGLFLSMESDVSKGKRYICISESLWLKEIAQILSGEFSKYGYKVPLKPMKYCSAKSGGFFMTSLKDVLPYWNKEFQGDNSLIKQELGIQFKNSNQAIIKHASALIQAGVVKDKTK
jgi:dihydroflavonol-4-reductase